MMTDILQFANRIMQDWGLLGFVFAFGVAFMQGKTWFLKINELLTKISKDRDEIITNQNSKQTALNHIEDNIAIVTKRLEHLDEINHHHDIELQRNTEQHSLIVKALEGHVKENQEHDNYVKASITLVLDRLDRLERLMERQ